MKKAALILSRPFERYTPAPYVIVADAGYLRALEKGIRPDLLVGDFDSLGGVPSGVETVPVPVEKDFSDGELGVRQAALRNVSYLEIYGAVGGRIDHFLYNLHLLKLAHDLGIRAVIRGDDADVYYTESTLLLDVSIGDTLSLVPFTGSAHILKATGLYYPATDVTLTNRDTLGLSNRCTEEKVYLAVEQGGVLVIHNLS